MYLRLVIISKGDCSQEFERRLRLKRVAMEELGKIKSNDVSLETKSKTIHILVFPITIYGCENWTMEKSGKKKKKLDSFKIRCWRRTWWISRTVGKTNKCILEQIKLKTSLKVKIIKIKLSYYRHHEEAGHFRKYNNAGKYRRLQAKRETRSEMNWPHKGDHGHKSSGDEQGCWEEDTVDITHS